MKYPNIDYELVEYLRATFPVDITKIDSIEKLEYNKGIQRVISHLENLVEDPDNKDEDVEAIVNLVDDDLD